MALDPSTVECLSLAASFVPTMSPGDEHRLALDRARGRRRRGIQVGGVRITAGRNQVGPPGTDFRGGRLGRSTFNDDVPTGRTAAETDTLNLRAAPHLQHLVHALRETRPERERVYELRVLQQTSPVAHQVLLCSDARVVFAEGAEGALRNLIVFGHGTLDVENELLRARAELRMGPRPVLVWPRLGGEDDVLDLGVRHVMPGPSPFLQSLLTRIAAGERGNIPLRAEPLPAVPTASVPAAAAATAVPAGWHPDPTGRHDHRWWNGVRWTSHAADGGVAVTDPL